MNPIVKITSALLTTFNKEFASEFISWVICKFEFSSKFKSITITSTHNNLHVEHEITYW